MFDGRWDVGFGCNLTVQRYSDGQPPDESPADDEPLDLRASKIFGVTGAVRGDILGASWN